MVLIIGGKDFNKDSNKDFLIQILIYSEKRIVNMINIIYIKKTFSSNTSFLY